MASNLSIKIVLKKLLPQKHSNNYKKMSNSSNAEIIKW